MEASDRRLWTFPSLDVFMYFQTKQKDKWGLDYIRKEEKREKVQKNK